MLSIFPYGIIKEKTESTMYKEDSASVRIKRAYRDYLRVKQYNKIKVSDIIKAADVNRSSFYRHFDDVYSLYTEVCDDLINVILLEMPVASDTADLRRVAEDALRRALTFVEEIKLLAGRNGNIQFLYKLRNAYFEALKTNAVKNGLWNEDIRYMVSFSSDYLTLSLNRIIMEGEISFPDLSAIDYVYDFAADPVDNVSEALRMLNGGRRDTQAAFLVSLIRRFSTGDQRAKPVTELFSSTGFSRAEFYKLYSHKSDYFSKLENALYLIVVKGVVPMLEADDPMVLTAALDNWDKYYREIERNAVINGMKDGYLLEFGIRIILCLYEEYKKGVEKRLGQKLTDERRNALGFFVASAACCFVYYIATMDREQYFRRINALYEIKRQAGV